ncbi:helix-turn-helix domain-containing protein [Streptomyces siamensis]|uniref:helix-turn-helix domain-containing protein n=1 Tax=Streptomyces siamensis TaxID=1274986 RepID=UPI0031EE6099
MKSQPDLKLVATVLAVVRRGSMAEDAAELGYVPSAAPQHIAALERGMGVGLITRRPRRPTDPHRGRPLPRPRHRESRDRRTTRRNLPPSGVHFPLACTPGPARRKPVEAMGAFVRDPHCRTWGSRTCWNSIRGSSGSRRQDSARASA